MASRTLVFVPGLLCSELRRRIPGVGEQVVWLGVLALLGGAFPRLALPRPGDATPADPRADLIPGRPLPFYYGQFFAAMTRLGWRVVAPACDWRRPYRQDAARLAQLLRDEAADGDLWIVCHSRGGLVVRAAFSMLDGAGVIPKIRRVVGLGVPHSGSLEAVANVGGWGSLQSSLANLGRTAVSYVGYGLGLESVRLVLRSWPAIPELLPSPSAPWLPPAQRAALYNEANYIDAPVPPFGVYLAAAKAAWESLTQIPAGLDWVDVVGDGIPTYGSVEDVARLHSRDSLGITREGDGVVPVASAHQPPRKRLTTPTAHDMMPLDGRLWPHVDGILRDGLPGNSTLGGSLLLSP